MKKQLIIMLGILVVLVLVAFIAFNLSPGRKTQKRFKEPVLGEVAIKDIKNISINDRITLSLDNGVWSFMRKEGEAFLPKPTRQDYVFDMLDALSSFNRGRLIDSAPEDLAKYHLSDEDGARVLILKDSEENELMRIRIGVVVGAFSANYAQINDNQAVYLVDEQLSQFLSQGEQYWLDLRLFPVGFKSNKIKSIKITKKDMADIELVLEKNNTWNSTSHPNITINTEAITSYLYDVEKSKAYDFSSPQLKDELIDGTLVLTFNNNNTVELTLYSFANKYFASIEERQNDILFLQDYTVNKLFPKIAQFEDKSGDLEAEESTQ